jgi:hypothetical protein
MIRLRFGKIGAGGFGSEWKVGDNRPLFEDGIVERLILGRIHDIHAAAEHRHGRASGFQGAAMRGRVDAARHAADDRDVIPGQSPRQGFCGPPSVGGGIARAHHRDAFTGGKARSAFDIKKRGRIGNPFEERGKFCVPERHEADGEAFGLLDFPFGKTRIGVRPDAFGRDLVDPVNLA